MITSVKHMGEQAQRRTETFPRLHSKSRTAEKEARRSGPMSHTGSLACLCLDIVLRVTSIKECTYYKDHCIIIMSVRENPT